MPIVTVQPRHIPDVARLHRDSIRTGLTAYLGQRFCERLYAAIARSPTAVVLVYEEDGRTLAFAAGTTNTTQMYRDVRRSDFVRLALAAGYRLLRPRVVQSAFKALRRPQRFVGERFRDLDLPEAEFFSVGVSPDLQSKGIGRKLTMTLLHELAARGVRHCRVWTSQDNQRALRFHQSCGFQYLCRRFDRDGDIHVLVRSMDDLVVPPSAGPRDAHEAG